MLVCDEDASAKERSDADAVITELFGMTDLSKLVMRLKEFGFSAADYDYATDESRPEIPDDYPYVVQAGDETRAIACLRELPEAIRTMGKKGIDVQRYKGLGEMNPEQLWDTTMDPSRRTLLRVKLADLAETDHIFTVLMGSEVEPRREFIESNALAVRQLDI
jgi:DNA gyrase subunit B